MTTVGRVRSFPSAESAPPRVYRGGMRNVLYFLGVVATVIGVLQMLSARSFGGDTNGAGTIIGMLVVVCGAVLLSGGAIVGAIEALRAPAPMPPQQWQGPPPGGPQMGQR